MSFAIDQITLYSLRHGSDGQLSADNRNQLLPPDDAVVGLMTQLHRIYNSKTGKGFGFFSTEERNLVGEGDRIDPAQQSTMVSFRRSLEQLVLDDNQFLSFSSAIALRVVQLLQQYSIDETGVLLLAKYNYVGTDYLLIALLEGKESITVSDALELRSINYLDTAKLNIAARIDLTQWQTQHDSLRYISFSKGRTGRKVGDLFLALFGASEGMDAKQQNRELLQAIDDYCDDRQLPVPERHEYKKQAFKYCNDQAKAGEEIEIKSLSAELPTERSDDFYRFIEQAHPLEAQFPADKATLRTLTKFVGSGGGLTLSFDHRLLNERVFYDPVTDTLTIKGTPPNLKDQLLRN